MKISSELNDHLNLLESDSIYALREAVAQFSRPVMLFSGGKDSTVMVALALKAFPGGNLPFPLMLIDTGHGFPETLDFIGNVVERCQADLIVRKVEDSIARGTAVEPIGPDKSRNTLQSVTLMEAIREFGFDSVIGGGRRDEEKARAKERVFSLRNEFGKWDAMNQRPELWHQYSGFLLPNHHMRIFPLSDWTELDVWLYILRESIELPKIYFSHRRQCLRRQSGVLLAQSEFVVPAEGDQIEDLQVRCRTVGDMSCTGLVESTASNVEAILEEILFSATTERGTRADDRVSDYSMENRKYEGYF